MQDFIRMTPITNSTHQNCQRSLIFFFVLFLKDARILRGVFFFFNQHLVIRILHLKNNNNTKTKRKLPAAEQLALPEINVLLPF